MSYPFELGLQFRVRELCGLPGIRSDVEQQRAVLMGVVGHVGPERVDEKISIHDATAHVGMSIRYLQKQFKSEVGYSPKEYHLSAQMDKVYRALEQEGLSASQVAERLGYSDPFAFSHQFKKRFGFSPLAVINRDGFVIK